METQHRESTTFIPLIFFICKFNDFGYATRDLQEAKSVSFPPVGAVTPYFIGSSSQVSSMSYSTLPDLQILLPYSCESVPERGKSFADFPAGFPVAKFSIGDKSCLVFTTFGRRLVWFLVVTIIQYVKRGELFQKFEPREIVFTNPFFEVREESAPMSSLEEDDISDLEDDGTMSEELGEDYLPICKLGEDEQKNYIEQMLLDMERFLLSVCGGESRVPPELRHLLSLIKSEAGNKGLLRNDYRLLFRHPTIASILEIERMMTYLKIVFGLDNLHEIDEEAENVLNTLDTSCCPASWVDTVKKVADSDIEYNYLNVVLNECKCRTCSAVGPEKADEIFVGVKGILIFLDRLRCYSLTTRNWKEVKDKTHRSYNAMILMFPDFFPVIFAAVYRSPVLRARLLKLFDG